MVDTRVLGTSLTRSAIGSHERVATIHPTSSMRRGKAPPVEAFTVDEVTVHWDDWLHKLQHGITRVNKRN